jgi:DNA-binding GntR family transcriptional regulator
MLAAIKKRDADLAEKLIREEVTQAAAEINRLIESDKLVSSTQPHQ